LEAINENDQGLVPWYTHIFHLPHEILLPSYAQLHLSLFCFTSKFHF